MDQESTYIFIGKLSDQSAQYYVDELRLSDGFFLEVLFDGIAVWGSTNQPFDILRPKISEMMDIIVSAFVFNTKKPLSYTLVNFIETKETVAKKLLVGWILNPYSSKKHHPKRSRKNTAWKKAAWFYNHREQGNSNHILALKDYRNALLDVGDDAFLFAYRAIEDICRAATECGEDLDWDGMHAALGTSKEGMQELIDVAKPVRHGDKNHPTVVQARGKRDALLNIAHEIIQKELTRRFPGFM